MRRVTIRALEIRDEADIIRGLTRGELEARILDAERAHATVPPEVSRQLRLTAQAEADAWQQAADAATRHDNTMAASAEVLASHIAAERQQLETVNARYEQWSAATTDTRETAARAKAELKRRRLSPQPAEQQQPRPGSGPPTTTGWWRQFEADLAAAERALDGEHQAAIAEGDPWPPQHTSQPEQKPQNSHVEPGGEALRLDQLLGQAAQAAERLAAGRAEQETKAQYAARIERDAQAEHEPTLQAQGQAEAEL
jgi:hypothetical protein